MIVGIFKKTRFNKYFIGLKVEKNTIINAAILMLEPTLN